MVDDQLPVYPVSDLHSSPYIETQTPRDRIALTFQTQAPNPLVKFIPLYQVLSEPYGIYFPVHRELNIHPLCAAESACGEMTRYGRGLLHHPQGLRVPIWEITLPRSVVRKVVICWMAASF